MWRAVLFQSFSLVSMQMNLNFPPFKMAKREYQFFLVYKLTQTHNLKASKLIKADNHDQWCQFGACLPAKLLTCTQQLVVSQQYQTQICLSICQCVDKQPKDEQHSDKQDMKNTTCLSICLSVDQSLIWGEKSCELTSKPNDFVSRLACIPSKR